MSWLSAVLSAICYVAMLLPAVGQKESLPAPVSARPRSKARGRRSPLLVSDRYTRVRPQVNVNPFWTSTRKKAGIGTGTIPYP